MYLYQKSEKHLLGAIEVVFESMKQIRSDHSGIASRWTVYDHVLINQQEKNQQRNPMSWLHTPLS